MEMKITALELIGTRIIDSTGRSIGKICDIIIDKGTYGLKYFIIARIYISILKSGFNRYIIPIEHIILMRQKPTLKISMSLLNMLKKSNKFILDLERRMKIRDLIAATLFAPITILLLCIGIINIGTIYGQVMFWLGLALMICTPALILETQFLPIPQYISSRFIYRKKIFTLDGTLVGIASDVEVDLRRMKATKLFMVPPAPHHLPEWLSEVYYHRGSIELSLDKVKHLGSEKVVLNITCKDFKIILEGKKELP